MITRLEIKGFKTLVDVSIELGAVNVFIGANGSGKSNLLEAVGLLSAIVSGSLEAESIRYRGVRVGSPNSFQSSLISQPNRTISMLYSDGQTSYAVDFGPESEHPSKWAIANETVGLDGHVVFKREDSMYHFFDTSETPYQLKTSQFLPMDTKNHSPAESTIAYLAMFFAFKNARDTTQDHKSIRIPSLLFFGDLKLFGIYSPSTPQLRGSLTDIQREPLGLGGSRLGQAIQEMMKGDLDMLGPFELADVYELIDWADALYTDSEADSNLGRDGGPIKLRIGDRYMGEKHKSVSLLEASEGALYVLFMLALVGHEESPKFFAVDNFDQALHPRLACALTRLISDQILEDDTRQMLATTHNPLVLDGLDLLDDRVRLFTVDRDATGASQVQRVLVTEELIEKGFSLSRLWTSGRLGGVPRAL